ncbi:phosphatidylserine decarboxylase [Helicobacter sp. 13S00477-4]|uniref:phosphatidylserine decarboxylase n=1 Tax=Helicobacter sp. 13S00477-4 TaxID=1905759 RepID=UPI000BA549BB|nr:phosphatidylserine decarboxylase [Helicobacter sp. 13S00477-4]PAF50462.1 hypothetical protein BKH44_08085 [Helicobacter sp. 13S00477-4]
MTNTQFIAKEGYKGAMILAITIVFFMWWGKDFFVFLFLLCLILWLFAFRNPERLPEDRINDGVFAPIDGKITNIFAQDDFIEICIDVDWFDVGVLRVPVDILSYEVSKKNGLFLKSAKDGVKQALNTKIVFFSRKNYNFKLELYPEIFSSAQIYKKTDFVANDRMGFMKIGCLCFSFPAEFLDIKVNVGDRIKGGQTLIGYLK